ncbi:MAG TPA: DDE-type integrase/transposase/recombinase [Elusimicrobiales bacterium]|nr:DDE-type integrase/transposase/recombinase [Elusimicrobiales bacterium]
MSVNNNRRIWTIPQKLEIVEARLKGLTLKEVSDLYKVRGGTVSDWTSAYEARGLAGLEPGRGGRKRAFSPKVEAAAQVVGEVLKADPEAGVGKVQGALFRQGFLSLARETVRKLLRGQGHGPQATRFRRRNRPSRTRTFERANPNDLWQTDIMTFMLKGQYRVYVIGFLDDNSRFITGWGLYRFQTTANVQEVFRAAIEKHGLPKEVLSDNGRQYHSWRGRSKFTEMLTKLGIRHIRSRPYHPQTQGKIESFWRNLLQECLQKTPVSTFEEAKEKIGEYVEYYNFKRPHQGIGNLIPSDRFYRVGDQVKQIIAANTEKVEAAVEPEPGYSAPTYLVGNIGGRELRVVAKDAQVMLAEKSESGPGGVNGAGETGEPRGEAGAGAAGDSEGGAFGGAVPEGGGVAGVVLPLDETGEGGGTDVTGAGEAGPEAGAGSGGGSEAAGGEAGAADAGEREITSGEKPAEAGAGGGETGDPAPYLVGRG